MGREGGKRKMPPCVVFYNYESKKKGRNFYLAPELGEKGKTHPAHFSFH